MLIDEFSGDFVQWLRGFYAVAQTGGVSAAARLIRRNQPTVSQLVRNLEKNLGVSLFDRSKGRMDLTREGHYLLKKTRAIFDIIEQMQVEAKLQRNELSGTITVATFHALILYYLPPFVVKFKREHPRVRFQQLGAAVASDILSMVESGAVDFGIISPLKVPKGMIFEPLFQAELKLISPKDNRFGLSSTPSLAQISSAPFISFPQSSAISQIVESMFKSHGLRLNVVQYLNNFEVIKKYVGLGMGLSILGDYAVKDKNKDLLVMSFGEVALMREYGVIQGRYKQQLPQVRAFIQQLRSGRRAHPASAPSSPQ